MNLIDNLSDAADQLVTLQLPDGSTATLELMYRGASQRWVFNLAHQNFPNGALNGQMLCAHPNILRNFKNLIPFGLAVVSTDGQDPAFIEDFANGRVSLYILSEADVDAVEQQVFGVLAA